MKVKKIKHYKFQYYIHMSKHEKEKFVNRGIWDQSLGASGTYDKPYACFPYYDETEKLLGTKYETIMPMGMLTADFLLKENSGKKRSISDLVQSYLKLSHEKASEIEDFMTISKHSGDDFYLYREDKFFNIFLLNAYFGQDEIDTYGDFVDLKGDEIYDEHYMKFNLPKNNYTDRILDLSEIEIKGQNQNFYSDMFFNFLFFNISSKTTKKDIELLKTITKEEMTTLISQYSFNELSTYMNSKNKLLDLILKSIRSNDSENEKQENGQYNNVNAEDVKRIISQTYASLLSRSSKDLSFMQINNYSYYLQSIDKIITNNTLGKVSAIDVTRHSRRVSAGKIYPIVKEIFDKESEIDLDVKSYVVFLKIFANSKLVTRDGTAESLAQLFNKALDKSFDNLLNLIKLFVEISLDYDGKLPSMKEWENELSSDVTDLTITPYLLIPMIITSENENSTSVNTEAIKRFRDRMKV